MKPVTAKSLTQAYARLKASSEDDAVIKMDPVFI